METFKNAAIALVALVLGLTFALAGCEGAGDDGSTGNNGYVGDDSNGGGDDTNGTLESGLVIATAPNDPSGQPFVGDFKFDNEVVCTNVSVCEFEATGSVKIEFTHPLALFLDKYATANSDEDQQVSWDKPGDWGLAPQGTYVDEEDGDEELVKTWIEADQILIESSGSIVGAVERDKFSWETEDVAYSNGTISLDLSTVSYVHTVVWSGKQFDKILKRVE